MIVGRGRLVKAVRAQSRVATEFFAENLDMHRFSREQLGQGVVDLLRNKSGAVIVFRRSATFGRWQSPGHPSGSPRSGRAGCLVRQ